MSWKEFLKPTWKKIVLILLMITFPFILVFVIFGPCWGGGTGIICEQGGALAAKIFITAYLPIYLVGFVGGELMAFTFGLLLNLLYLYILSCLILYVYDKIKSKK